VGGLLNELDNSNGTFPHSICPSLSHPQSFALHFTSFSLHFSRAYASFSFRNAVKALQKRTQPQKS